MERYVKILAQSLRAVIAFKLRTFFCLVSVALGIASITVIVAATEGAYKKAFDIVGIFGPDSLLVVGGSDEMRAVGQRQKTLTLDDVQAVKEAFPSAYVVTPMTNLGEVTVSYTDKKTQSMLIGATNDYSLAWTWPVVQGSDFTEDDVKGSRNVGLVGQNLVDRLFEGQSPVGKYVFVRNLPVQIVGVLAARGMTPTGVNLDDRIVLPLTTVMTKIQNERKYIPVFRVRFTDQQNLDYYANEVKLLLRQRHKLPDGEPDNFKIISPKEIIAFLVALTGSLVVFIGIVGVISLIVAGFVLANLFLLSVRERTTEIGIRRSVGAKKLDIRLQFLGEAVIITTFGGLTGFAVGVVSSQFLTSIAQFPIHFSWKAFAVGLLLSWLVGIGFGLQPAAQAANLKPIEAIRG
jgi:putative ABC transport system permease protein